MQYLENIITSEGPVEDEYQCLSDTFEDLHRYSFSIENGLSIRINSHAGFENLRKKYSRVFRSTASMQGFAFLKPNGYAGDYEIIERIYNNSVSHDAMTHRWDLFFHKSPAVNAVRNRADVIFSLVNCFNATSVLSVGCGPALDIIGTLSGGRSIERIGLLDNDIRALDRAKVNVNSGYGFAASFINRNALRFRSDERFDIVWSSGLFDYLSDKLFCFLLGSLRKLVASGGRLVVGNFSTHNPSRAYMECVGEWFLFHRTKDDLFRLAKEASLQNIEIISDRTGVNLFLVTH